MALYTDSDLKKNRSGSATLNKTIIIILRKKSFLCPDFSPVEASVRNYPEKRRKVEKVE